MCVPTKFELGFRVEGLGFYVCPHQIWIFFWNFDVTHPRIFKGFDCDGVFIFP
jgi:hypothetical protein